MVKGLFLKSFLDSWLIKNVPQMSATSVKVPGYFMSSTLSMCRIATRQEEKQDTNLLCTIAEGGS
jgi:hypothetical protein